MSRMHRQTDQSKGELTIQRYTSNSKSHNITHQSAHRSLTNRMSSPLISMDVGRC